MALYVGYFKFKPGANPLLGLQAFERRKEFQHPHQANVIGEFWVNAPPELPQVVLIWEAEDEAAGDYYDAAWGDIFDISISLATRPVPEIPADLPADLSQRLG
ncbi:MAG: hypothetical protein WEC33_08630 [Dehalococcoidia bacterium]